MVDSCYICRRTQVDLDHLNEEVRTRVYLSYFSNARTQIDEQQRKISFLQRLRDEEGGDPHFRISSRQVFGDPGAYKKLMPWVDTLIEIYNAGDKPDVESRTIGELVEQLLAQERRATQRMEQSLMELRNGFATGTKSPLALESVTRTFSVDWTVTGSPFTWRSSQSSDREPLRREAVGSPTTVEMGIYLCSMCRKLTERA